MFWAYQLFSVYSLFWAFLRFGFFLLSLIRLFAVGQAPRFDLSASLPTFLRHCRNSAPNCPNFGLCRSFSACSAQFVEDSVLSDIGEVSAVTVSAESVGF